MGLDGGLDDDDDDEVMITGERVPLRDGELRRSLRSAGAAAAVAGAAKAGEVVVLLDSSQPDGLAAAAGADGMQVVSVGCREGGLGGAPVLLWTGKEVILGWCAYVFQARLQRVKGGDCLVSLVSSNCMISAM